MTRIQKSKLHKKIQRIRNSKQNKNTEETLLESDYVKRVKYYNDLFLRTMQDVMISSKGGQ